MTKSEMIFSEGTYEFSNVSKSNSEMVYFKFGKSHHFKKTLLILGIIITITIFIGVGYLFVN